MIPSTCENRLFAKEDQQNRLFHAKNNRTRLAKTAHFAKRHSLLICEDYQRLRVARLFDVYTILSVPLRYESGSTMPQIITRCLSDGRIGFPPWSPYTVRGMWLSEVFRQNLWTFGVIRSLRPFAVPCRFRRG